MYILLFLLSFNSQILLLANITHLLEMESFAPFLPLCHLLGKKTWMECRNGVYCL